MSLIEKLEERFVLNEITKEQFEKFSKKYRQEQELLTAEMRNNKVNSSNLEKAVEKGMGIAQNISKIWSSSDFSMKQSLQYLVFPVGILFNKKMVQFEPSELIQYSARLSNWRGFQKKPKMATLLKIAILVVKSGRLDSN